MNSSETNHACGQLVVGLPMGRGLFVAASQSTPVAEPCHRAFHDVTHFSQTAAMLAAARSQQAFDLQGDDGGDDPGEAISAIANQSIGFAAGTTSWPLNRRKILDHFEHRLLIADVGGCGVNQQRQALCLRDDVTFAPVFPAIYGTRPRVRPQKWREPIRNRPRLAAGRSRRDDRAH